MNEYGGQRKGGKSQGEKDKRRLKWYGHVMRGEEHDVLGREMEMKVQGRRKEGKKEKAYKKMGGWCD